MAVETQAPLQQRSVDPFSDNRFSSTINRLTRILTSGEDVILYPDRSFTLTILPDQKTLRIGPGMCIKDDVFIHIRDDFDVDFEDPTFYVDDAGEGTGMDTASDYYVFIEYVYTRTLPSPKAYYKLIKDLDTYYTSEENKKRYIFLGAARVTESSPGVFIIISRENIGEVVDHEAERPIPEASILYCDGGWIDNDWEANPTP